MPNDPTLCRTHAAGECPGEACPDAYGYDADLENGPSADDAPGLTVITWTPRTYGSPLGYLYTTTDDGRLTLLAENIRRRDAELKWHDGDQIVTVDAHGLDRKTSIGQTIGDLLKCGDYDRHPDLAPSLDEVNLPLTGHQAQRLHDLLTTLRDVDAGENVAIDEIDTLAALIRQAARGARNFES